MVIKVLFVCTGNICRSPTAEGVFRHLARQAGLERSFHIDSAGTDSYHIGEKPDARAIKVAGRNGVALDGQRARSVEDRDFAEFDYIFAMDGGHFSELGTRAPEKTKARIRMFLENGDVPDPWSGTDADFERIFCLVQEGAVALLKKIREERGL